LIHPRRVSHRSFPLTLPLAQLLRPAPHLVLKSEELRALHWREEFRELTLLALNEVETLPFDVECFVEQLADFVLVRLLPKHQL